MATNKERRIRNAVNKTNSSHKISKSLILGSRSLLKTIKRFSKKANMIGMSRITKTQRLMHVDSFSQVAMKKRIFNIQFMNRPRLGQSNTQNNANDSRFDHWAKSFITVNTQIMQMVAGFCGGSHNKDKKKEERQEKRRRRDGCSRERWLAGRRREAEAKESKT